MTAVLIFFQLLQPHTPSTRRLVRRWKMCIRDRAQYTSSIPSVTVDGVFGSGTAAAVRAFQRKYGLTVDGVVGQSNKEIWMTAYE